MAQKRTRDLTTGSPMKLLLSFLVPILLSHLFQQFYNMADSVIVGRFLGAHALAGVGSTSSITFLVLGFNMGICAGFTIPVAQKFGEGDDAGLRRMVGNIVWLAVVISAALTVATVCLCRQILTWMNNPPETFGYSRTYLMIIFLGIPATTMYNLLSGIIRSLGDSRTPLLFLVFSCLLNVVLDLVLILWADMGVAGAAVATVASQLVSGILCLVFMIRSFPILHLKKDDWKPRREESRVLLATSLPMGLQYSITGIGTILLQASVNALGPAAMAAATAGDKVNVFMLSPLEAMGAATATYVGQNVGARKLARIHAGNRANSIVGLSYCAFIFAVAWFFGDELVALFLDSREQEMIAMGHQYLWANASCYGFLLYILILRFSIQGMGFSSYAVYAGILELIGRGSVALFVIPHLGFEAVGFAAPFAWVLGDCFLVPMYFFCMKKLGYRKPEKSGKSIENG